MHEPKIDDPDMLANMDPPRLTRIRRLALTAFAAPKIREMHDWTYELVDRFLDRLEAAGPGADFVELVSWDIPLRVLAGILGVAEDDIDSLPPLGRHHHGRQLHDGGAQRRLRQHAPVRHRAHRRPPRGSRPTIS